MGKNVLKSPGVVLGNPSTLLRLAIILFAFFGVGMTGNHPEHVNLLQYLNVSMPPEHQLNISQTEYVIKHREYFDLLEQRQTQALPVAVARQFDDQNIVLKRLHTFSQTDNLSTAPSELIDLNYVINIPEERNKITEVDETSLRLLLVPTNCNSHWRILTMEIRRPGPGDFLKRKKFLMHKCLPQWVGIDMTGVFNANINSNYQVSIQCEECLNQNIRIRERHLNVIVNVKPRLRRRREKRKKRKNGYVKCMKKTWEIDIGMVDGYEHLIQPKKFDAGLCTGMCNKKENMRTQHSSIQLKFSNIDKTIPRPCCAPSKFGDLEVLLPDKNDPNKLKMIIWNSTRLVDCACS